MKTYFETSVDIYQYRERNNPEFVLQFFNLNVSSSKV